MFPKSPPSPRPHQKRLPITARRTIAIVGVAVLTVSIIKLLRENSLMRNSGWQERGVRYGRDGTFYADVPDVDDPCFWDSS